MLRLGDPPGPDAPPKLAVLSRLRAAGLPVPDGLGLAPTDLAAPTVRAALSDLLARGPVIVRAALAHEDTADTSGAGLGRSIADCHDLADIDRAAAEISAASRDPWLLHHLRGAAPSYQLLIQHQVPRRWLAVLAAERTDLASACLELHDAADFDALAAGATPAASGPLALAAPPLRAALTSLLEQVSSTLSETPALDLEVIVDPAGAAWLVQARPLVRPLVPGWPEFLAAAAPGRPRIPDLPGLWRLDAEHNPAALSPAHAGLIAWLAERGAPLRVLAGWLYEPVPQDTSNPASQAPSSAAPPAPHDPAAPPALHDSAEPLDPAESPSPSSPPDPLDSAPSPLSPARRPPVPPDSPRTPQAALAALRTDHLPAARRFLAELTAELDTADAPALAAGLDRALAHLQATLACYAALRVPAPATDAADRAAPLCLRERAGYLDVLPAAWDIASPALSDMLSRTCPSAPDLTAIPDDPALAAVLLRELDDHLFALGLAPLRRVYLAAGARLGLDPFLLTPLELHRALTGGPVPDLAARRRAHARDAALAPPLALLDGRPVPLPPRGRLRGLPSGPTHRGPIARRRDLADLLARPPGPEDIIVLPALTAQAAVALQALSVRAVCCEHGGALSHAALMVRELGLSALVGCRGCSDLPDGVWAELDTRLGRLRVLPAGPA